MCSKTLGTSKISFRLKDLQLLLTQKDACVSCVSCKRNVDIMPSHLANLNSSMKELLNGKVTKYDVELEGIILAHRNVKILANSIQLSDNRTFPLEYMCDIYVFKPKIGSTLTGVVNKISPKNDCISVLVHDIFNVAVQITHDQKSKVFFKIGLHVTVTVSYLDFTGRLPYIRATYSTKDNKHVERIKKSKSKLKNGITDDISTDGSSKDKMILKSILKPPSSKSATNSDEASAIGGSVDELSDSIKHSAKKKKHKKDKKHEKKKKNKKDKSDKIPSAEVKRSNSVGSQLSAENGQINTSVNDSCLTSDITLKSKKKKHKHDKKEKRKKSEKDKANCFSPKEEILSSPVENKFQIPEPSLIEAVVNAPGQNKSSKSLSKKRKRASKSLEGPVSPKKIKIADPLNTTVQLTADMSIFKAASSTPVN